MSTKQDHKRWRRQFNEDCFHRDKHACVYCGCIEFLDAHHITDRHEMPNGGYVLSNGITVCEEHHLLCEEFHRFGKAAEGYSPTDLYLKIGSSHEKAIQDSLKLK